jgi:hypothetical protein
MTIILGQWEEYVQQFPHFSIHRGFHGACLDTKFHPKFHYTKRRFPVTSKYRHMHGVLNIDKIKKLIVQFCCTLRDEYFEPN